MNKQTRWQAFTINPRTELNELSDVLNFWTVRRDGFLEVRFKDGSTKKLTDASEFDAIPSLDAYSDEIEGAKPIEHFFRPRLTRLYIKNWPEI